MRNTEVHIVQNIFLAYFGMKIESRKLPVPCRWCAFTQFSSSVQLMLIGRWDCGENALPLHTSTYVHDLR